MKGYKAFDKDLKCRELQYTVGKTTKIKGSIELCKNGLHFCEKLTSVFNYYPKTEHTRVCEVESSSNVITENDKSVTDSLKIIRELSKEEIKQLTDSFKFNSGDYNSGQFNSGQYNSGQYNSGGYNSGQYNSGRHNSGRHNSGGYNSGQYNSGHYNSGDYNSGQYNSGGYNSGQFNSGLFNTNEPTVRLFNKETTILRKDLPDLGFISREWKPYLVWVYADSMTDQEKKDHPYHTTTGGFIRKDTEYSYKKSWERVWNKITDKERDVIKTLPNFCPTIFKEITGINVNESLITVTINGVDKQISKETAIKLGLL